MSNTTAHNAPVIAFTAARSRHAASGSAWQALSREAVAVWTMLTNSTAELDRMALHLVAAAPAHAMRLRRAARRGWGFGT